MTSKSIIDLNAVTVELLHKQDYVTAIEAASEALRLQQKTFQADRRAAVQAVDVCDGLLDQCMLLSKTDDTKTSAADAFIYDHGIVLPPTIADKSLISAILIFNSALAHQLCAETGAGPTIQLLHRANNLYKVVSEIPEMGTNILFQFAVMNNLAVIEKEIGDKTTATSYFEVLMEVFMLMIDQDCSHQLSQVRGFLMNVRFQIDAAGAA
ncbi:MAG: hypothetical protein SGBAC_006871 [Bacillariaceae sp.]